MQRKNSRARKVVRDIDWFHTHAHSKYSWLDGMSSVEEMVAKAVTEGQPALSLTEHGVMSSAFQLYKECKKNNIKPFIGIEIYFTFDKHDDELKKKRYHLILLALNTNGYKHLVHLNNKSHERKNFHRKPLMDWSDLEYINKHAKNDIVLFTGCFFGLLIQTHLTHGIDASISIVNKLKSLVPNTFVELQHHGKEEDDEIVEFLLDIAKKTDTPTIITADSHYTSVREQSTHDLMKSIAYYDTEDNSFPGDPYHLSSTEHIKKKFSKEVWRESLKSNKFLLDNHDLVIEKLDNYKYDVPKMSEQPDEELRQLVVKRRALNDLEQKRVDYELQVIKDVEMSDYFLLIKSITDYMDEEAILFNARGSASSSMVCYLLGITKVNPIEYGLDFARFMSRDRSKPPDIDLDVEANRRQEVIDWIEDSYNVVQLGTYSKLGIDEWGRGSLFVQYLAKQRRKYNKADFKAKFGTVKNYEDLPKSVTVGLGKLSDLEVLKAPSAHAAGYIVHNGKEFDDIVPKMLIPSSGLQVTQMQMDDVENAGFVKVDLLGLRTLETIKMCVQNMDEEIDEYSDIFNYEDKKTFMTLRRGVPYGYKSGIFQFEGWTAMKGCREMQVNSLEDCILIMALYRPATLNTGYTQKFLDRRFGRESVDYPHEIFEDALKDTMGLVVYQEQVLQVLRILGIPDDNLNQFLSAIKVKHGKGGYSDASTKTFKENQRLIQDLCLAKGLNKVEYEAVWSMLEGFHSYGFNKAHAVAYGTLGYETAYLKTHYPIEYMSALLQSTAGTPKEKDYVQEALRLKIKLKAPDVNRSNLLWSLDTDGIRKGLVSIDGIGVNVANAILHEREDAGEFSSLEDMISRVPARSLTGAGSYKKDGKLKGNAEKLRKAGALRSLGVGRFS